MGLPTQAIDTVFDCPFHGIPCPARLTLGRNGEVVYHDPGFAPLKREFQTIPELAVALRTRAPKRLRPILLALWRIRLLHEAGLLTPPEVDTPHVPPNSPPAVHAARNGFELLVRCRWFLDPGEPVPFTRSFAETWCGLARQDSRRAIFELIKQQVIVKVGEIANGFANPTYLYLPGRQRDET
ncbi:MAG: hypothetical protein U0R50_13505 [Gaiellales bacterium]